MKFKTQWKQRKTKYISKGIVTALTCTGLLCFSVLAEEASGPSTNVWLDVIQIPTEARVSVTVPLSYGFVVVGSVESGAAIPVSTENGNLLLPNVRVVVREPSGSLPDPAGSQAKYEIQTIAGPSIPVRNYSTDVRKENMGMELPPREGLPVEVRPYIVSIPTTKRDEFFIPHHWEPVPEDPTWDGVDQADGGAKFKKFQMLMDNLKFSVEDTQYLVDTDDNGRIWPVIRLEDKIPLEAPPSVPDYGYTSAGTAQIPSEKYISVGVRVGGMQNQYKQVEQSVKAGVIYWEVIPGELPAETSPGQP